MNVVPRASQWGELIRPDRVHGSHLQRPRASSKPNCRTSGTAPGSYVGHESEVPNANDYRGQVDWAESVIMTRDEQGNVNLLLNRCSHRGNQGLLLRQGQRALLQHARSIPGPSPMTAPGRLCLPDGYEGPGQVQSCRSAG